MHPNNPNQIQINVGDIILSRYTGAHYVVISYNELYDSYNVRCFEDGRAIGLTWDHVHNPTKITKVQ